LTNAGAENTFTNNQDFEKRKKAKKGGKRVGWSRTCQGTKSAPQGTIQVETLCARGGFKKKRRGEFTMLIINKCKKKHIELPQKPRTDTSWSPKKEIVRTAGTIRAGPLKDLMKRVFLGDS